jgi:hypothetical protein
MTPVAVTWGLRPVIRAARVGEHKAVVWNRLYRRPCAASLSMLGEETPPPKTLNCPKPTSSRRISTMLGAPFGGRTICGKVAGSES